MNAAEPTILCPKCGTEIKLAESLAAPLVKTMRRDCRAGESVCGDALNSRFHARMQHGFFRH